MMAHFFVFIPGPISVSCNRWTFILSRDKCVTALVRTERDVPVPSDRASQAVPTRATSTLSCAIVGAILPSWALFRHQGRIMDRTFFPLFPFFQFYFSRGFSSRVLAAYATPRVSLEIVS